MEDIELNNPIQETPLQDNSPHESDDERKARRRVEQQQGEQKEALKQKARAEALERLAYETALEKVKSDNSYIKKVFSTDQQLAEKLAKNIDIDGKQFGGYQDFVSFLSTNENSIIEQKVNNLLTKKEQEKEKEKIKAIGAKLIQSFTSDTNKEDAKDKWDLLSQSVKTEDEANKVYEIITKSINQSNVPYMASTPSYSMQPNYNAVGRDGSDELAFALGLGDTRNIPANLNELAKQNASLYRINESPIWNKYGFKL